MELVIKLFSNGMAVRPSCLCKIHRFLLRCARRCSGGRAQEELLVVEHADKLGNLVCDGMVVMKQTLLMKTRVAVHSAGNIKSALPFRSIYISHRLHSPVLSARV